MIITDHNNESILDSFGEEILDSTSLTIEELLRIPSYGVKKNITPKILIAALGDGYKQRAADGINSMPESWNLTWANRLYTDIDTIENFFIARAGHESFDWINLRGSESKKYICTKWSRNFNSKKRDTLMVTFEQVWDY